MVERSRLRGMTMAEGRTDRDVRIACLAKMSESRPAFPSVFLFAYACSRGQRPPVWHARRVKRAAVRTSRSVDVRTSRSVSRSSAVGSRPGRAFLSEGSPGGLTEMSERAGVESGRFVRTSWSVEVRFRIICSDISVSSGGKSSDISVSKSSDISVSLAKKFGHLGQF